jgi:hypothetical protein
VEIGTEAAQFPEKEYINGNFIAVQMRTGLITESVSWFLEFFLKKESVDT